jgi:hypothetical protein
MPRIVWPLFHDQPIIEVFLTEPVAGLQVSRQLLADTGAGTAQENVELVLEVTDCVSCGGSQGPDIDLTGAFQGPHPAYLLRVQIPALSFDQDLRVVAVPVCPGFDGIACFRFLNRFTYGNFGDPNQFGLET